MSTSNAFPYFLLLRIISSGLAADQGTGVIRRTHIISHFVSRTSEHPRIRFTLRTPSNGGSPAGTTCSFSMANRSKHCQRRCQGHEQKEAVRKDLRNRHFGLENRKILRILGISDEGTRNFMRTALSHTYFF